MPYFCRGPAGSRPVPAAFFKEVVRTENHGVGGAIPPRGTTQNTSAKKLRGDRWLAIGTPPRSGAAQGLTGLEERRHGGKRREVGGKAEGLRPAGG